jgi:hypothetical protein
MFVDLKTMFYLIFGSIMFKFDKRSVSSPYLFIWL